MKEIEIFDSERARQYDASIKIWCPDYDFIQDLIPSLLFQRLDRTQRQKVLVAGCGTGAEMAMILKANPL